MPQLNSIWTFTCNVLTQTRNLQSPRFEEGVKAVIATFAVFTGIALKDYVTSTIFGDLHWYAVIILGTLLLRYIIGSATHLTYTYAQKDAPADEPNSAAVILLIKDLGFLVVFGVIAVRMSKASDFPAFLEFARWFLAWGLIWSVTDALVRFVWCKVTRDDYEWPKRQFWLIWAVLDAAQLAVTWLVPNMFASVSEQATVLAVFYVLFLYLDLKAMARTMQVDPVIPPAA